MNRIKVELWRHGKLEDAFFVAADMGAFAAGAQRHVVNRLGDVPVTLTATNDGNAGLALAWADDGGQVRVNFIAATVESLNHSDAMLSVVEWVEENK